MFKDFVNVVFYVECHSGGNKGLVDANQRVIFQEKEGQLYKWLYQGGNVFPFYYFQQYWKCMAGQIPWLTTLPCWPQVDSEKTH